MPIFSEQYLNRLIDEAEQVCSAELRCIRSRTTLHIEPSIHTYTLPPGTIGIEEVAWLGQEVLPAEQPDYQRSDWFRPVGFGRQSNRPESYLTVGNGFNKIQFYPVPSVEITADDTDVYTKPGIMRRVVIQAIRIAQVNGEEVRLPAYLFRHIMKYYAMARAYAKEGPSQSMAASKYFDKRYNFFFAKYREIIFDVPKAVELTLSGSGSQRRALSNRGAPYRGRLPQTGKWSF